MWIVTAKCLGMTGGTSMSLGGRSRSGRRMTEYTRRQAVDAATGNERRPTAIDDMPVAALRGSKNSS